MNTSLRRVAVPPILVALLSLGCQVSREEATLTQRARTACAEVPRRNRALCEESIRRLALDYRLYRVSHANFAKQFGERRQLITRYRRIADVECGPNNRKACERARIAEAELEKLKVHEPDLARRLQAAERRFTAAIAALPAIVARRRNAVSVICRRLPGQRIVCQRLGTILAYYDSALDEEVLQDIDRLLDAYEIDRSADILIGCGAGAWGGATLEEFDAASGTEFLTSLETDASTSEQMLDKCSLIQASVEPGGVGTAADGFSGLTGLDPFGGLGACRLGAGGEALGVEGVIEQLMAMTEAFHAECRTGPWETLAEGGVDGEPGPGPESGTDASDDASLEEDVTDNGDGTETVCTSYGCYVRYKDASTSSSSASANDLNTTCTEDGTCTTEVSGLDEDNDPIRVKETVYPDGTREIVIEGDGITVYGIETPDDHRYEMICKGSLCRDTSAGPGEPLGDPWDMTWQEYEDWIEWLEHEPTIGIGDCIEGPCMTCSNYSDFMWNLKQGCVDFGTSSGTCQSYMREAECCANPDAFPVDPRVVLPNPSGDYACYGTLDQDFRAETCEQRCGVAEHEDCTANCLGRAPAQLDYDMMDVICTMAISDDCFYGSSGFSIGEPRTATGGTPPPVDLVSHRVMPEMNRFGDCDANIEGCADVEPR